MISLLTHAVLVVLVVASASFFLLQIVPGDPAALVAGLDAAPETVQNIRRSMNLDDPVPVRYFKWISGVVQGDFGESLIQRRPVKDLIRERLPVTLRLAVTALVYSVVLGIVMAFFASAGKRGTIVIRTFEYATFAFPQFWIALLFIYFFAFQLRWFPMFGVDQPRSMVLPALSLALPNAAVVSRTLRADLHSRVRGNHALAARILGIPPVRIFFVHLVPLAMIPLLPVLAIQVGYLLAGAIVVEQIFGLPGLGRLTLTAIMQRDLPVIQGSIVVFGIAFPLLNALAELCIGLLVPRLRKVR